MNAKQYASDIIGVKSIRKNKRNKTLSRNQRAVSQKKNRYQIIKRSFDVSFSILSLIILSPLFLFISVCIVLTSKGPVIYRHSRIGKGGKIIEILKFRTMINNADQMIEDFDEKQMLEWQENYKVTRDPRVTRIGKILRITSMDELPQFINIIRGDMSLIGPRPVIAEELEKYGKNKDKFLSTTPGLTGYWQAYARNDCSYQQRMEMELDYVENASLWWDIRILFASIARVLSCNGAR